jgi:hypothetical protein
VNESASLGYLTFAFGYKYNIVPSPDLEGLGLNLSLSLGIPLNETLHSTILITDSNGVQTTTKDNIAVQGKMRLALKGGISYDIPLGWSGTFIFSPFVGYDFALTNVDNTTRQWTASSVYAGIALHYSLILSRTYY